jgi:S1-C subfamily serine protease
MDFKVVTQDRMELYSDRPEIVSKTFAPEDPAKSDTGSPVKFGIIPRALTDDERNLTADKRGVSVQRVDEDSFAEEIGLMEHDIITAINRQPVNSPDDVRKVAQSLKPGDAVTFRVIREPRTAAGGAHGAATRRAATESDSPVRYLAGTARN